MKTNPLRLAALGCGLCYLMVYLFMPFIRLGIPISPIGYGISGSNCLSGTVWAWFPLLAGIGIIVCSLVLPGTIAAIVNLVASFIPLFSFLLMRNSLPGSWINGLDIPKEIASGFGKLLFSIGTGPILMVFLGIGSAVLVYLSENHREPIKRTPGLGATEDEDW